MATNVALNGITYSIPRTGDSGWSATNGVDDYLVALATAFLSRSGGAFTLTSEVNFGGTAGLKALYFKSRNAGDTANAAAAGQVRLANADTVSWRNAANSADLPLTVSAANVLTFNGAPIVTLALGAADTGLVMNAAGTAYTWAKIANANIDAAAAIAYSKLALTGTLVNADVNASAAIAYSKLNLATSIVNADIAAAAAIAHTKLANITAGSILMGDASNVPTATAVTGDVTVTSGGVTAIAAGVIVNADVNAAAAIAGTKVAPDFGSQNIQTTGTGSVASNTLTGTAGNGFLAATEQSSSPSTPASGLVRLYAKTDKKLYTKDSAGTETQVGANGSGELNLIDNPSDSNNWTETGTVFNSSPVTTTTAGDLPLAGTIETAIKITSSTVAGAEASEYVSYAFTTPASLGAKLKVEFYLRPGTNFTSNEWTVSVYAGATRQALSTDASSVTYIPNASGKFTTTFDCVASTAYTLRFARPVNAAGNAGVLNVANVIVGPGIQPQGAVVGPWLAYTPTFTGYGTATFVAFSYRQVGGSIEVRGRFTTGTNTATTALVSLPAGFTVDTTQFAATLQQVGTMVADTAANNSPYSILAGTGYTTAVGIGRLQAALTALTGNSLVNNSILSMQFAVPIAELAGAATVNLAQNDVEYAYNSDVGTSASVTASGFAYGPSGVNLPDTGVPWSTANTLITRRVRFSTPVLATDRVQLEYARQDSNSWLEHSTSPYFIARRANNTEHGISIDRVSGSSTDVNVYFSAGGPWPGATFDSATIAWTAVGASLFKWRLKKTTGGAAVGFAGATQTSLGLAKAGQFPGTNTNDSAVAGYVGEHASGSLARASATGLTTGTAKTVTSVSLTAGDWDIGGAVAFTPAATTSVTSYEGAVSLTTNTLPATTAIAVPNANGELWMLQRMAAMVPGSGNDSVIAIPTHRISLSATTTVYLIASATFTVSTMSGFGGIWARRVR